MLRTGPCRIETTAADCDSGNPEYYRAVITAMRTNWPSVTTYDPNENFKHLRFA